MFIGMRHSIAAIFIVFVALTGAPAQPSDGGQDEAVAQELMQLERGWVTASIKRDKVWLEQFLADEFVSTHPTSGTVKDKTREIADTIDPKMAVASMTLGEMRVRVIGEVAIVTGSSAETGGGGHLTDTDRSYLFTDTFLKRNGKWQLIASHSSRMGCP